jgi:hypothetical protein
MKKLTYHLTEHLRCLGCNRAVPSGLNRRFYCESHTSVPLAIQGLQPNQIFYGALESYLLYFGKPNFSDGLVTWIFGVAQHG